MKSITRISLFISLFYCFCGIAWVMFSDVLLTYAIQNNSSLELELETIADIIFILLSSVLIFSLVFFFNKKYTRRLKEQFKKQQEALEKSEKLFRAIIENTNDIISLTDKDGKVLYANPALEKLTGFTLAEMKGKPIFHAMDDDLINESKTILQYVIDNPGVMVPRDKIILNKNTGSSIFVQGTLINLLHDKNVGAIVSNYRNVTEKKLIAKKVEFDHNNLKALINNTNDLMWSVDKNFKLITSNKAFDDLVLFLSGQALQRGSNVLKTGFPQEQINRFKTYYERAFAGETFSVTEHTVSPIDYWSEISFYPILNQGITIGTACFSRDITERKKSDIKLNQFTHDLIDIKNKLERNEHKLKQAQAIAHVGSWEVNFATGMALWSDESCRIYGISPSENKQSFDDWKSFIHPDDLKYVLRIIKKSHNTLHPPYFHHRIIRKDGSIRYIDSKTQFDFNAAGEPIGIHGVAHDVTEQKLAEQEILQKNNELRNLTNHLQHIREEERASISREIHDELGQQLTVLKMDLGWIMRKQTNPNNEVIEKLNQMLLFSNKLIITIRRISADLRPAIIDDLGLVAALDWICEDFTAKSKIPCKFISNIKERKFDEDFSITTYRILQESLTNIIRHAQAKSVTVTVNENNEELFLEITDDGKGICVENIKKGKTLGVLGMKERAGLFGGELIISGVKNKGTRVKLKLPFKKESIKLYSL